MTDQVPTPKHKRHNRLTGKPGDFLPTPKREQRVLYDIGIKVERKIGGIEMGVLENGVPYLTQRGLTAIAGVTRATIRGITREWEREVGNPVIASGTRLGFLKEYLFSNGYDEPKLYLEILKNNTAHYAYPDVVCMAIIEFFAFESKQANEKARRNYRRLARHGLQKFIYEALSYVPEDQWRYFYDRVSILKDRAPDGYFIVFKEVSGLIIDLITSGLSVNDKTIPDASTGIHWGRYWSDNGLNEECGERVRWEARSSCNCRDLRSKSSRHALEGPHPQNTYEGLDVKHRKLKPRKLKLVKSSYQPSKAELEEDVRVDAAFDELIGVMLQPVKIEWIDKPEKRR